MSRAESITISASDAACFLVAHLGLRRDRDSPGIKGAEECLRELRCIQLDPLDRIGSNAELVVASRVAGLKRREVYELLGSRAFEQFAKERCILPAASFSAYRARAIETPWWRLSERLKRLPTELIDSVYREVRDRGPLALKDLEDRGSVEALDWSGWKGTGRAATMAAEVLWTRCQIVVVGRSGRGKVFDLPERVFAGEFLSRAVEDPWVYLLKERAEACGLLSLKAGPWWSTLDPLRKSSDLESRAQQAQLQSIEIKGLRGRFLAPADFCERAAERIAREALDDRLRILAPLDPLIWDRKLVAQLFGFEYLWEVYKPAAERRWGYYVCPLLYRGRFVGRVEARFDGQRLVVEKLWKEARPFPAAAWRAALERREEELSCRIDEGLTL